MEKPTEVSSAKMFGGYNKRYKHFSPTLGCSMTFHIYFPPSSPQQHKLPVLYWLSGLTCTDENFIIKSGAQRAASTEGVALIAPDTSPRNRIRNLGLPYPLSCITSPLQLILQETSSALCYQPPPLLFAAICCLPHSPSLQKFCKPLQLLCFYLGGLNVEGEADSWDFGVGAGFYLNATQEKWKNWRMYDYVVKELPQVLSEHFPQLDASRASIFGHSMGGHGALTIYLKNLDKYKSVSAFAPIANPINCAWGQKAFSNYLGSNKSDWEEYDASNLVSKFNNISTPILIDQGEDDKFLHDQLLAPNFEAACKSVNVPLILRMQPGYDHSFFFIATFIDDHIRHHAQVLNASKL